MRKGIVFLLAFVFMFSAVAPLFFYQRTESYHKLIQNAESLKGVTEKMIDVPTLCQYPQLPTGCEATAAAMVLQYYGVKITAEEFAENWLPCSKEFYWSDDKFYGPDPNEIFVGNPFSQYSYGCFASPIVQAINANSTQCKAEKITNASLAELSHEYIDNDKPLLIWATMRMTEVKEGNTWYFQDDSVFTWPAGEHCLVLVGYDGDEYYLNDPQTGSTVSYPKSVVEKRFSSLGSQAVCIDKKGAFN